MSEARLRERGVPMARILGAALFACGLAPSQAFAKTDCAGISNPTERLACYDALDALGQLDPTSPVPAGNEAAKAVQPAAADWSLFGMPATQSAKDPLNEAAAKADQHVERDDDGDVEAISSSIVEFSVSADNMLTVVLANGQVWRQVSGRELHLKTQAGAANAARISRTLMGGFAMTVNGRNDVAIVKRLDGKRKL